LVHISDTHAIVLVPNDLLRTCSLFRADGRRPNLLRHASNALGLSAAPLLAVAIAADNGPDGFSDA